MSDFPGDSKQAFPAEERIQVLLEEYRALNTLLVFRLGALERRIPTLGGTLSLLLGSVPVMPPLPQAIFLMGLPAATAWFLVTTVSHARAKEDHLRRIDEIERIVNRVAGEELLVFQSRHPGHDRMVGGRSGVSAILAVFSACLMLLVGCVVLFGALSHPLHAFGPLYQGYVALTAAGMAVSVVRLCRYRYTKPPAEPSPPFIIRSRLDNRPLEKI